MDLLKNRCQIGSHARELEQGERRVALAEGPMELAGPVGAFLTFQQFCRRTGITASTKTFVVTAIILIIMIIIVVERINMMLAVIGLNLPLNNTLVSSSP